MNMNGKHTFESLRNDMFLAGLETESNLIVHSSLRSIGGVSGGAETVVNALMSVIGADGNLLVPTFTYSMPSWGTDPFNVSTTPSRVGYLSEYIRTHPDSVRSFHPTHSVTVLGKDGKLITENHLDSTPIGSGSPYDRMLQRDAGILLLGTSHNTNSSLHLLEALAELPYIHVSFTYGIDYEVAWYINRWEQVEYSAMYEIPGCSRGFPAIERYLREQGIIKDIKIGDSVSQFVKFTRLRDVVFEVFQKQRTILLCDLPDCQICRERKKLMGALSIEK